MAAMTASSPAVRAALTPYPTAATVDALIDVAGRRGLAIKERDVKRHATELRGGSFVYFMWHKPLNCLCSSEKGLENRTMAGGGAGRIRKFLKVERTSDLTCETSTKVQ